MKWRFGAICFLLLSLGGILAAADPIPGISGTFAYTEIMRFDYTRTGVRSRVQFCLEMEGRAAVGKPGDPAYQPPGGFIRYYLLDADSGKKVLNWRDGLDMTGLPADQPLPMTDVVIEGNTARFEAFGMKWTVVDGGEGYQKDRVFIDDGFQKMTAKLYAGDLKVGPGTAPVKETPSPVSPGQEKR